MGNLSDYRHRPHWSYSSLHQLLFVCSLAWYFERVEKLPRPFKPVGLALGSAFHRVMEFIALSRMDGGLPSEADTRDLFNELWKRECADGESVKFADGKADQDTCGAQGMDLCAAYLEQVDPEEEILGISEAFTVPLSTSDKPLVGELDCVVSKAGKRVVVDWKTSARRWPKDQADRSMQPTAYMYAHRQLHPDQAAGFRFDVVVKNMKPVVEQHSTQRTDDDFRRLEALVAKADAIVQHELYYPADTSFYCDGCSFREACRRWH